MSSLIDITQSLGDPDFVAPIQQISRKYQVDSFGKTVITECVFNTVGSVQPISGADVQKVPELMRVVNMKTFWIKGQIIASEPGKYSDILVFLGRRFQILTVDDWSQWGVGYSQGVCVAEIPAP